MAVQDRLDVSAKALVLSGDAKVIDSATIAQDAGATAGLASGAVVSQNPTSGKWQLLDDASATDGTEVPRGVLVQDIELAALQAGDVANCSIMVGGPVTVDRDELSFGGSVTLDTVIASQKARVDVLLNNIGIFAESVSYLSQKENS